MNWELPDVQAGFQTGRGNRDQTGRGDRDQIANILLIMEKAKEFGGEGGAGGESTLTSLTIRVFSNESVLRTRWPKYWSFSFSISPSNEYSGLLSFTIDWFDLLAIQGTLKSLQQHSSKHQFFSIQLSLESNSHLHTWLLEKTIDLTRQTFVGKVMSLLFNMLSRLSWRRWWHPTLVLLPGKSHGWRSLVGWSPWFCEKSDMTERLHFHFSLSWIGEGNGNPLQCSCLENPRDGGALWAAVCAVYVLLPRVKHDLSNLAAAARLSRMWNGLIQIGKGVQQDFVLSLCFLTNGQITSCECWAGWSQARFKIAKEKYQQP